MTSVVVSVSGAKRYYDIKFYDVFRCLYIRDFSGYFSI